MPETQNIGCKCIWKNKFRNIWDNENMKFSNPFGFVYFIKELT